jgi:hypothetical protein
MQNFFYEATDVSLDAPKYDSIVAFLCAMHPRCGAGSVARDLPVFVFMEIAHSLDAAVPEDIFNAASPLSVVRKETHLLCDTMTRYTNDGRLLEAWRCGKNLFELSYMEYARGYMARRLSVLLDCGYVVGFGDDGAGFLFIDIRFNPSNLKYSGWHVIKKWTHFNGHKSAPWEERNEYARAGESIPSAAIDYAKRVRDELDEFATPERSILDRFLACLEKHYFAKISAPSRIFVQFFR